MKMAAMILLLAMVLLASASPPRGQRVRGQQRAACHRLHRAIYAIDQDKVKAEDSSRDAAWEQDPAQLCELLANYSPFKELESEDYTSLCCGL